MERRARTHHSAWPVRSNRAVFSARRPPPIVAWGRGRRVGLPGGRYRAGMTDRTLAQVGAGVAAVALAAGFAELAAGWGAGVSPASALAERVITLTPGELATAAIGALGKLGRPAVVAGVGVGALALGGLLGRVWARSARVAAGGMILLGAVAAAATALAPEAQRAGTAVPAALAVGVAAVIGAAALPALARWLTGGQRPAPGADSTEPPAAGLSRRRLLVALGAAAVVGVSGSAVGAVARSRRALEVGPEEVALPSPQRALEPAPAGLDIDGLAPLLTPNSDFYRIDTAISVPRVDAGDWSLRVHGLVARPFTLTLPQLLELDLIEADVTLACVSNEVGHDLVGTARWLGVPLAQLLERAGVQPGAEQVVGRSVDGWTAGFPVEAAFDGRQALVAVGMNGQPLPARHGFPARLVVPGLYGYVSATKWLSEIELAPWDFDAYWVPRGWAKEAPIRRQSRIDRPAAGAELDGPAVVVAGVAWSPLVGVEQVELQVDDGDWQPAELGPTLNDASWRQWVWRGELASGEHRLRVRCVGGDGKRQTGQESPPRPDGATGWHTVSVTVA